MEKRRFGSFPTKLKAQYLMEGEKEWKECTIINMSREEMDIIFQTPEKMDVDSTMRVMIHMPTESKPINAKAIVRWIEKRGDDFIGGIMWHLISRGETIE